jgi:hypothetical protein
MPITEPTDGKDKECPLCGAVVPGGAEGMNRHFELDCPWRHTSKTPGQRAADQASAEGPKDEPSPPPSS